MFIKTTAVIYPDDGGDRFGDWVRYIVTRNNDERVIPNAPKLKVAVYDFGTNGSFWTRERSAFINRRWHIGGAYIGDLVMRRVPLHIFPKGLKIPDTNMPWYEVWATDNSYIGAITHYFIDYARFFNEVFRVIHPDIPLATHHRQFSNERYPTRRSGVNPMCHWDYDWITECQDLPVEEDQAPSIKNILNYVNPNLYGGAMDR